MAFAVPLTNHVDPSEIKETLSPRAEPAPVVNVVADAVVIGVVVAEIVPARIALGATMECCPDNGRAEIVISKRNDALGAGRVNAVPVVDAKNKTSPECSCARVFAAVNETAS